MGLLPEEISRLEGILKGLPTTEAEDRALLASLRADGRRTATSWRKARSVPSCAGLPRVVL